jgi:multidrug efflux pump subunit AcrB
MTLFAFTLGVLLPTRAIGPGSKMRQVPVTSVVSAMLGATILGHFVK